MTTSYSQSTNPNATNSELDAKKIVKNVQLTSSQRDKLIEQFVELQTDSMDLDTMVEWIQDILTNDYDKLTDSELKERVDCYDEELYDELVDNIVSDDEEKEIERLMEDTTDDIIVIDSPNSPNSPLFP